MDEAVFSSFELERIDPNALLFQTGYITIASATEFPTYTLSYPNREVRDSLLRYLLAKYTQRYAKKQGYLQPYVGQGKAVKAIGFDFSFKQKALDEWQIETIP